MAGQFFLHAWALLAVGLGTLFALRPEIVIKAYRLNLELYRLPKTMKARMEPPPYTALLYRIGGRDLHNRGFDGGHPCRTRSTPHRVKATWSSSTLTTSVNNASRYTLCV